MRNKQADLMRPGRLYGLMAALAALLLSQGAVLSQTPSEAAKDIQSYTREQASRTARTQSLTERAAGMSGVVYKDILASPDDPKLNLVYIRGLIAKGNVQLAAATTERILLQYPESDDVRLLYAILLYRMDMLSDASMQLDLLDKYKPSAPIQAEITRYRDLIKQRLAPSKRSAAITVGMHYDSNRNSFPNHDTFLVGDDKFVLPNGKVDDWGRIATGAAQIVRDTGKQSLQQVSADMIVLYDDQVRVDALDVNALLLNTGFFYRTVYADLLPRVHASWVELNRHKFSQDYSGSLRVQRPVFQSNIHAFTEITAGWRDYNNTATLPFASDQDSNYQRFEFGGDRQIDATTNVRLTAAINRVDAEQAYEGYDGFEFSANLTKVLPRGTFVLASATMEKQYYDGHDPFVSFRTREDRDWQFDLTYGVPLGTIAGLVSDNAAGPAPLRQIILNLTAGYHDSHSNIPNYQYDNFRGQFMFNRNWEF